VLNYSLIVFILSIFFLFLLLSPSKYLKKSKKIFRISKKIKRENPTISDRKLILDTAECYFDSLNWNQYRINSIVNVFRDNISKINLKNLPIKIFYYEFPENMNISMHKRFKRSDKIEKKVEKAYNTVFKGN